MGKEEEKEKEERKRRGWKINKGSTANPIGAFARDKVLHKTKDRGKGARKEKSSWCMKALPIYCSNCKSI